MNLIKTHKMAIVFEFELFDLLLHAARIDYENTNNLREVLIFIEWHKLFN